VDLAGLVLMPIFLRMPALAPLTNATARPSFVSYSIE
jgi:hypothetical protein